MQRQTAWVTGFLTQLLLNHLYRRYPDRMQEMDPRTFFSGCEGYESIKNPLSLLMDSHAWLPEEVLRELHRTAERVSGRKDVAYEAAMEYFRQVSQERGAGSPSLFEIIARSFEDVRTVARCSELWAGAYTTFLRLQSVVRDPSATEVIILAQCREGFPPLIANHYMIKGNYEGFVRLYDFVQGASLEEEFLQHRVRDIVAEFDGYDVEEDGAEVRIVDRGDRRTIAVLQPVFLESEDVPFVREIKEGPPGAGVPDLSWAVPDGWVVEPRRTGGGRESLTLFSARLTDSGGDGTGRALRVSKAGCLRSGPLEYLFREGAIYDAPYSRYRFRWREHRRPSVGAPGIEKRLQQKTYLLFDYLHELKATQQRLLAYAAENKALTRENVFLRQEARGAREGEAGPMPMGNGPRIQAVLGLVRQVAAADSTVIITGETGTGKEVIARMIHELGSRRDGRFVPINCGAIPESLLESELFGHERGAFTGALARKIGRFEWADGGTLFLDEVGELPPSMQVKLLRVLQERVIHRVGGNEPIELDVRIIAATHQDLKALMEKGAFRSDFYYRLNVIPIHLPPLCERGEDLPALTDYFITRFCRRLGKTKPVLTPAALERMRAYAWPGNIRELENILERVMTLLPDGQTILGMEHLPIEMREVVPLAALPLMPVTVSGPLYDVREVMDRIEWKTLKSAMEMEHSMDSFLRKVEWAMARRAILEYGSKTEAARMLKRTYRWIRKLEKEMTDKPSA
ncbi:MAG TPA: sigma-54 dependent transcriptional regulator [Nitrospiria bacterium]